MYVRASPVAFNGIGKTLIKQGKTVPKWAVCIKCASPFSLKMPLLGHPFTEDFCMDYTPMIITSRQNAQVSLACKLGEKKHRQSEGLFRFDGVKLYCEAVKRGVELVFILVDETQKTALDAKARSLYGLGLDAANCRILYLSHDLFVKISDENAPEGIICVAKYIDKIHKIATIDSSDEELARILSPLGGRVLLCESLRDPGNVGTVIRTAFAFGIDWLILSGDCADLYNPKVLRGAMGTLFSQRILRVDDLAAAIEMMRASGRRVYAAALDESARQLGSFAFSKADSAVIGNEGHGLSEGVLRACDASVYIPMAGDAESLNASVAAAVLMWEMCRND